MISNPVFIFGGFVNGLGLVHSFLKKKTQLHIPIYVFDVKKSLAGRSRFSKEVLCPCPTTNSEEFIDFIIKEAKNHPYKPVLLVTNDIWLVPIAKNKKILEASCHVPMSNWDVIHKCYNKNYLYQLCKAHNISQPQSFLSNSTKVLRGLSEKLPYPVILKPVDTIMFQEKLGWPGRNKILNNKFDVENVCFQLESAGLSKRELILQEYIPGDVKELFTYTSYSNREGNVKISSIGHKIRQYPMGGGTISSGKISPNKKLEEVGKTLIKCIRYYGIANTEFKRHPEKNDFYLIEINARPGMWNKSALLSGANIPFTAYCDTLGIPFPKPQKNIKELTWFFLYSDFRSFFSTQVFSLKNILKWKKSLFRKGYTEAVWYSHDPYPFLWLTMQLILKIIWR